MNNKYNITPWRRWPTRSEHHIWSCAWKIPVPGSTKTFDVIIGHAYPDIDGGGNRWEFRRVGECIDSKMVGYTKTLWGAFTKVNELIREFGPGTIK